VALSLFGCIRTSALHHRHVRPCLLLCHQTSSRTKHPCRPGCPGQADSRCGSRTHADVAQHRINDWINTWRCRWPPPIRCCLPGFRSGSHRPMWGCIHHASDGTGLHCEPRSPCPAYRPGWRPPRAIDNSKTGRNLRFFRPMHGLTSLNNFVISTGHGIRRERQAFLGIAQAVGR